MYTFCFKLSSFPFRRLQRRYILIQLCFVQTISILYITLRGLHENKLCPDLWSLLCCAYTSWYVKDVCFVPFYLNLVSARSPYRRLRNVFLVPSPENGRFVAGLQPISPQSCKFRKQSRFRFCVKSLVRAQEGETH